MLTIPLYILLIIYGIYLLACAFFVFINIGHLIQTASLGFASYIFTIGILITLGLILWLTYLFLSPIDMQQQFTIFNQDWFGGIFSLKESL